MLTPKGKMLAELRIIRRADDVLLETARGALDNVTSTLRKFVPPLFARWEPLDDTMELGVYGPAAAPALERAMGCALEQASEEDALVRCDVDGGALLVVRTGYTGGDGFDVMGPRAVVAAVRERLLAAGAAELSEDALEALRIEAGRPRWGAELDENVFPLEAGLEARAISKSKGCYTGQEVIVRILHRGHVNWMLRGALPADDALPARDAPLLDPADGRKVGRITSACFSPRLGRAVALAYTRRELAPPATVKLERPDGADVVVTDLPFPNTSL
jgi:folate-binding protein YgfZ